MLTAMARELVQNRGISESADCAKRIEIYSKLTEDQRKKYGIPSFQTEIQKSLVQQVWQKYIRLPLTWQRQVCGEQN